MPTSDRRVLRLASLRRGIRQLHPVLALVAGAVAGCWWLAAPAPAAAASPSPDGERLAFSFLGGPESLYLARSDGSEAVALVAREAHDFRPEWFPDGRRLLFTSAVDGGPQLWTVDTDGSGLSALTPVDWHASDGHPSPDGTRIVFFDDAEDGFDLHLLDLASGDRRRLTETPDVREYAPRFSPDGDRILFVGRSGPDAPSDVWSLDLATGERRNLTSTGDADEFHPAWSPDGRRIAFVRSRGEELAIHVLELEPRQDRRVAFEPGVACFSPHFTPDGRFVVFTRNVFSGARPGLPGVFRVRRDGALVERIAGVPGSAGERSPLRGLVVDPRDGAEYPTVEIGGLTWMARHLAYASRESYCYENRAENCTRYGRLYRWEAALAACPDGWHLASDHEWQQLELVIGIPFAELAYRSNRGIDEGARLKPGGDLGFDVEFAGWRDYAGDPEGLFRAQGEAAAIWTATETDLDHAWHRDIDDGDDMVYRSRVDKSYALSVRCVRNRSESDVLGDDP